MTANLPPPVVRSVLHQRHRCRGAPSLLALFLSTAVLAAGIPGTAFADGGKGGDSTAGNGGGVGGTGHSGGSAGRGADGGALGSGGGPGGGGGGAGGGAGGAGASNGGSGGAGGANGRVAAAIDDGLSHTGGAGRKGGDAPSGVGGGGGGAGGYGLVLTGTDASESWGDIAGGAGGGGGNTFRYNSGGYAGNGGGGGDGGVGAFLETSTSYLISGGTILGGMGGDGGYGGLTPQVHDFGGDGGDGGDGVVLFNGGMVTIGEGVTVTGGNGGKGGESPADQNHGTPGGSGGAGGTGVTTTSGTVIVNAGATVIGGDGGAKGAGFSAGTAGAGAAGIVVRDGGSVAVAGRVIPGESGDGSRVADAIDLFGGGNTLTLLKGYSLGGNAVSDGDGDTLALGGDPDASFDLSLLGSDGGNKFQGFSTFDKTGSSTWTLTNVGHFYSGATTISAGTLVFDDASIDNSQVTIGAQGTLSATSHGTERAGDVGGLDVFGTLTLGSPTTSFTSSSDNIFEDGSTFNVQVDGDGHASIFYSGGAATLKGVDVLVTANGYDPSLQYVIIQGGQVQNQSSHVAMATPTAFVIPKLNFDVEGEVYLTFTTAAFESVAETANQQHVAAVLDNSDGPLGPAVLPLSADEARAAYDAMSGDAYASVQTAMLDDSRIVRDTIADRLLMPVDDDAGKRLWGRLFGDWDSHGSDGNAAGFSDQTKGLLLGSDGMLGDWRLGALLGYGRGAFSVPDRGASASIDSFDAALYAGTSVGAVQFRSGAGYTRQQVAMSRTVALGDIAEAESGAYGANLGQVFAELGYRLGSDATNIEPFGNVANVALHTDGFAERGGDAALTGGASDADVTLTTLGLHSTSSFVLGTIKATARATIGWQHAFGSAPHTGMAFGDGDAFDVAGVPVGTDAAIAKFGLDLGLAPTSTFNLSYSGKFAAGAASQTVSASLNTAF
jgi:outer membrane autotransporter protein